MKKIKEYFEGINLPSYKVTNGSILYGVDKLPTDNWGDVIHRKYYPLANYQIDQLQDEVNKIYHTEVSFPSGDMGCSKRY